MSFTDHKITAFAHKIADLPDEPQLPAADLKSRFDACPEELRQSLNAVCDDAARLEARVEGIVVDTFGDTIDKEMLSDELAAELDGMADGIEALGDSLDQLDTQKCEVYFGNYKGDGYSNHYIQVPANTKVVFAHAVTSHETFISMQGVTTGALRLSGSQLHVIGDANSGGNSYYYICFG